MLVRFSIALSDRRNVPSTHTPYQYTGTLAALCRHSLIVCFLRHLPRNRPPLDTPNVTARRSVPECVSYVYSVLAKEHRWLILIGCTFGLNFVYVAWGVLQVCGFDFVSPNFISYSLGHFEACQLVLHRFLNMFGCLAFTEQSYLKRMQIFLNNCHNSSITASFHQR